MIQRKAFKKWLFISALCGAHSFFWGVMGSGNFVAMLVGILSLAAGFAFVESHPHYQAKRTSNPKLARALDWGVKFRCWLAVYIPLSVALAGGFGTVMMPWWFIVLGAPYIAELFIGLGAVSVTRILTGINIENQARIDTLSMFDNFIATYLSTIFTGIAHTLILALICFVAYKIICIRDKRRNLQATTNNSTSDE